MNTVVRMVGDGWGGGGGTLPNNGNHTTQAATFRFTREPRGDLIEEYLSEFNYFIILNIASDGINAIVTHFIIAKNEGSKRIRTHDLRISRVKQHNKWL